MDPLEPLLAPQVAGENTVALSSRAWGARFSPLPAEATQLLADTRMKGLSLEHRRAIAFVCARRLQYGFALDLLRTFIKALYAHDPALTDLPEFQALEIFADCALGEERWGELLAAAETGGHVMEDLASTATFLAGRVPDWVCVRLLDRLSQADGPLEPVPAYRRVGLLRRLGRAEEARAALDEAFASLMRGTYSAEFIGHMSERLVLELLALQGEHLGPLKVARDATQTAPRNPSERGRL